MQRYLALPILIAVTTWALADGPTTIEIVEMPLAVPMQEGTTVESSPFGGAPGIFASSADPRSTSTSHPEIPTGW